MLTPLALHERQAAFSCPDVQNNAERGDFEMRICAAAEADWAPVRIPGSEWKLQIVFYNLLRYNLSELVGL